MTRRYPAEWENQHAVWLSWPHNKKEWGKRLSTIKKIYKELISNILNFQDVNLIFTNEELLTDVETLCTTSLQSTNHKLKKIIIPNNDVWIRDYGPFFIKKQEESKIVLDFEFNAWGRKFPPWDLDNKIPKEIALYSGLESESYPIVLEGGALEFSGNGLLLTTEQCLLNKNRNQNLSKEKIESILKSVFNIEEIIWLKRGLVNDHTDGHIDNVARFIGPNKVLICRSYNPKEENFAHLFESTNYLRAWTHPKTGKKLEIIEIPLPDDVNPEVPYSYANFIFVNGGVIVPLFNSKTDKLALKIFSLLFPDRKVVGIDSTFLLEEGGGIHCITKQEFAI